MDFSALLFFPGNKEEEGPVEGRLKKYWKGHVAGLQGRSQRSRFTG
jgi:hypothetical protein